MRPKKLAILFIVLACSFGWVGEILAQDAPPSASKQDVLWAKLEKSILEVDHSLDGVMGVAIVDLSNGRNYSLHADQVFPQASSIKICILVELYRQAQQGKLKLTDMYTVNAADLVQDSDIMGGLTPGVTKITCGRPGDDDGCGQRQFGGQCPY
jgi:Beta-lactamase class A